MAAERLPDTPSQMRLRIDDVPVAVPVAQHPCCSRLSTSGDHSEPSVSVDSTGGPCGDPVHAAHVTGEEGHDKGDPRFGGSLGSVDDARENGAIDRSRGRLEVV